nr:perilipin-1 [Pogona vitticeps]
MATQAKEVMQNGKSPKESHAWQRLLDLPVVHSAWINLQRFCVITKEVHPLMATVWGAYEWGLRRASSLATWSVRPVVQKLEPQLAVANHLACQGLDHLEERIPALHQPIEKVTADLKETVSALICNATHAMADFVNRLRGAASDSYEQSETIVKDTMEHVRRSRVSVAAEAGIDAAMGKLENVIDFFLQKAEEQSVHEPTGSSKAESPTTLFGKASAFAGAVCRHVYEQTRQTIQVATGRGWAMATRIPGLTVKGSPEQPPFLASLAQNLQTAYLSTLLLVKNAPSLAWNATGQLLRVSSLREAASETGANPGIFQSVVVKLLGSVSRCIRLPQAKEKAEDPPGLTVDPPESTGEQAPAALVPEGGAPGQIRDARRLSRGHYPLPFINLDDPLPTPRATSGPSAFSPDKRGAGPRRWSEGLFRLSPEAIYMRAHYSGLYGATFKKD